MPTLGTLQRGQPERLRRIYRAFVTRSGDGYAAITTLGLDPSLVQRTAARGEDTACGNTIEGATLTLMRRHPVAAGPAFSASNAAARTTTSRDKRAVGAVTLAVSVVLVAVIAAPLLYALAS
jgi:hypothetical protein